MIRISDGFFEDREDMAKEIVKQQQKDIQERRDEDQQEEYMENIYDFHKFTADPGLRRFYKKIKEIDKNWVFGNYNQKDENVILMCENLISDVDYLLPDRLGWIKIAILRDIFSRISISRGRKGFAAKLFVTQIGSTKAEISGLDKKKGFGSLLSMKKRG